MEKEQKERTVKALDDSIARWGRIANGTEKQDDNRCSLCDLGVGCSICPIHIQTEGSGCEDTPYSTFNDHYVYEHSAFTGCNAHVVCPKCEDLAIREVKFLMEVKKKFLKEEEPKYYVYVENPETAIGDGQIRILVNDEDGNRVPGSHIISILLDGTMARVGCVNRVIGSLKLDGAQRIVDKT